MVGNVFILAHTWEPAWVFVFDNLQPLVLRQPVWLPEQYAPTSPALRAFFAPIEDEDG